jgi:hypothetical protein
MQCDKESLFATADASNKRNLMSVGGHADNFVDLCGEDSADGKHQCLGKGQTMLTKPPNQAEFQECWSETIIKCGLSPSVVDDPLFRKSLVTTARMGQSAVCMDKGTALEGRIHSKRRNKLHQKLVEKLIRAHTNLVLRESLDNTLHHLLPWDIELVIDEPVDEPEEEPEV